MRRKVKNTMRSPEEKEKIVLESNEFGVKPTARKYDISFRLLEKWREKYRNYQLEGLKSKTGKNGSKHGNGLNGLNLKKNKTEEEELKLKVMKLEIEVARLKKGYQVKGVGSKKEYVTIKDLNTKS